MSLFLTKVDYEIARKNGINEELLEHRFYEEGMDITDATSKPRESPKRMRKISVPKERRKPKVVMGEGREYEEIYQKSLELGTGLSYSGIYYRMEAGWSEEDTLSKEIPHSFKVREADYIKLDEENGISFNVYRNRRIKNWSVERATTAPVNRRVSRWKNKGRGVGDGHKKKSTT